MPPLFYGTRGPKTANIVVVGEAWGVEESLQEKPFVGSSGQLLDSILREANLDPNEILFTNLISERPPSNDFTYWLRPGEAEIPSRGLNPTPDLRAAIFRLYAQLSAYPRALIIACGNYPLWALTTSAGVSGPKTGVKTPTGISSYHGSQLTASPLWGTLPAFPLLPLFHPAAILREWALRATTVHDLRMRVPRAFDNTWQGRAHAFRGPIVVHGTEYSDTCLQLLRWYGRANDAPITLGLDIETKFSSFITCIGLGDDEVVMSIPFVRLTSKGFDSFWSKQNEVMVLAYLTKLLSHPNVSIIGQNLNYDCQWLWHHLRCRPKVAFDTLLAQNLLFPGTPKDLSTLSAMYCFHHRHWKEDNREWSTLGTLETHLNYNAEDVVRTLEIAREQLQVLAEMDKLQFLDFELARFELGREMNQRGIRRDPQATLRAGVQLTEEMTNIGTKLNRFVKIEWLPTDAKGKPPPTPWFRSDKLTKFVLYELMKLPVQTDRKTGRPSSGKEALNALRDAFPRLRRFFDLIADYNSLDTIYSTFIKAKTDYGNRMRCSFGNTETFRWTSSKTAFNRGGNLQNIPVGEDE